MSTFKSSFNQGAGLSAGVLATAVVGGVSVLIIREGIDLGRMAFSWVGSKFSKSEAAPQVVETKTEAPSENKPKDKKQA